MSTHASFATSPARATRRHSLRELAAAQGFAPSLLVSLLALSAASMTFAACDRSDLIEVLGQARPWEGGAGDAGLVSIPFTVFKDDVGDKASSERRVLFKTKDAYAGFFGHGPPAGVDFGKDWVIFYAAGTKPTGGHTASVVTVGTRVIGDQKLLQAVTRLVSPGSGCGVTTAITTPHVLIKFAAQTDVFNVDFARADTTQNCDGNPSNPCAVTLCPVGSQCVLNKSLPPQAICVPFVNDPCATVRCAQGTHCEAKQVQCVRAPCPPIAECVKDVAAVRCGGIAGRPCPGRGQCNDDPSDSCDPANGGADCGGICSCPQNVGCNKTTVFDPSPAVCACVPAK